MDAARSMSAALGVALLAMLAVGCGTGDGREAAEESKSEREQRREAAPATVRFATFPSITRLTPTIDVEDRESPGSEIGDTIALEAARGEREAGQFVAWSTKGAPRVVLVAEPLRRDGGGGSIPRRDVRTYIGQAMQVEHGSPAGRSGTFVDPLVPAARRDVRLGRDDRLLAWVDVEVPEDAAPGRYEGSVQVRRSDRDGEAQDGKDGLLAEVPVAIVVRAARIPDVPTLGSHVGVDASQLVRFEGVEAGSPQLRATLDRYGALLADARLSIGDVGALPPKSLPGHAGAPGDAAYLSRVFGRRGVASVRIPFYMDYPFADPIGRDRARAIAYLRSAARWARSQGFGDRMYVFAIDEPDASRAGEVRELHELVRAADPALPVLVTIEASRREFRGSVDIWAPNVSPDHFREADVVRERRAGRPTWWYPSITTWQPYPTLFIDDTRPSPRALGWLAWQRDVRGILYWSATHWHEVEDPYRDPGTYNESNAVGNGDGVLVYPGGPIGQAGTPAPSVRLLQLRDGIEDHDLLVAASCVASSAERRSIRAALRVVAPSMDGVDPASSDVKSLRTKLFDVIGSSRPSAKCIAAPRG